MKKWFAYKDFCFLAHKKSNAPNVLVIAVTKGTPILLLTPVLHYVYAQIRARGKPKIPGFEKDLAFKQTKEMRHLGDEMFK